MKKMLKVNWIDLNDMNEYTALTHEDSWERICEDDLWNMNTVVIDVEEVWVADDTEDEMW